MQAVRNRLLQIEDEFISSLADHSPSDLTCFESKFRDDIQRAIPFDQANDEILELANSIITRSSLVAQQFSHLNREYQELTESLQTEVEAILNPSGISTSKSYSKAITPVGPSSLPPYIAPAYQWLMENLHCPYPTVAKKDSLAKRSGNGRKAVDAWFIDVRKRIGWSSLRKSRYQGKKKEIIREATDFFKEGKHVATELEFASIYGAAKELYSGKLGHSKLATHIGTLIDRKRGPSPPHHSSVTSEDSSLDEGYSAPLLNPLHRSSRTKTSSKRSRPQDDREELEHDLRSIKRQRIHPGSTHIPVAHHHAQYASFESKSRSPTRSSSPDGIPVTRPEECIDLRFIDSAIVPTAETSCIPTLCTSPSSNRRRFVSDSGPLLSNDNQSKAAKSQPFSGPLVVPTPEASSEWNLSGLPDLITPSCNLDDIPVYDVEAFDWGSFNPLQISQIIGAESLEPVPTFSASTSSNTLDTSNGESNATYRISDFSLSDPPSISAFDGDSLDLPATLNALQLPSELNITSHKGTPLVETNQAAGWSFGGMDNLFQDILQTPLISSTVTQYSVLREEKKKKLQQLAEMRLAQQQLEAEIATLDSQFS